MGCRVAAVSGREGTASDGEAALAWRTLGSGDPLLMINGYAATKADWDPTLLENLGSFAELLCPDNRGVGDSAPVDGEVSVRSMAADAVAVLDELGVERTAVLGWSMGGFVAQQLAATVPDRVSALVLLSTDGGGPGAVRAESARWKRLTDHSGSPRQQARRLIELLFPPGVAPGIDKRFGEIVAEARAALDPRSLSAQERAIDRWHAEGAERRLGSIGAPALCAAGSEDVVIPPANTRLLADSLTGSWRALFSGGGHAFMAQEPARLARLIRAFLDR